QRHVGGAGPDGSADGDAPGHDDDVAVGGAGRADGGPAAGGQVAVDREGADGAVVMGPAGGVEQGGVQRGGGGGGPGGIGGGEVADGAVVHDEVVARGDNDLALGRRDVAEPGDADEDVAVRVDAQRAVHRLDRPDVREAVVVPARADVAVGPDHVDGDGVLAEDDFVIEQHADAAGVVQHDV